MKNKNFIQRTIKEFQEFDLKSALLLIVVAHISWNSAILYSKGELLETIIYFGMFFLGFMLVTTTLVFVFFLLYNIFLSVRRKLKKWFN